MNKVLILCDLFPPAFAPRMGYLSKYLPQLGWEPVVLTEQVKDEKIYRFLEGQCRVKYVNYYTAPEGFLRKIQWLVTFILDFFYSYKDRKMCKAADQLLKNETFDVVLCSSYRDFPLSAARKISRKYGIPYIVDLRDIVEQFAKNEFISHKMPGFCGIDKALTAIIKWKIIRRRNRALGEASYVTTVSPWHVDMLRPYNPNIRLIYNGYDPELFYPSPQPSKYFIIIYTGRMSSIRMHAPGLLLSALKRLSEEKVLSSKECRIHWYMSESFKTDTYSLFESEGLLDYLDFKGNVQANELPAALNQSSILLLLANKASVNGPQGIMTTKVFEYLAVEKPILCVRSDESYLAELIHETQSGIAAVNVEEVYNFIRFYYNQWKTEGQTSIKVNRKVIESYSRKKQAEDFIRIFEQTISANE